MSSPTAKKNIAPRLHPVILFDGVCNLCNASVQFVIRRDKHKHFRFAALQSEFAQEQLQKNGLNTQPFDSFVLIQDGRVYTRSTAALRVARKLDGLWPGLYIFIAVPPCIRNAVYDFISRKRYQWFGKKEHCMIPTPENRALFLD